MKNYDAIVVGAGSIGVPTALALGAAGRRTLVLDMRPSPGQGDNKHAIGGIRATHSAPAKIVACERSIEVFSTWQENYGDDIEWQKGGYIFPVYRETEETVLKGYLPVQQRHGLNIAWVGPEEMAAAVPGINRNGLRGGTIAPDDGSASPLLAINAFFRRACALGVEFRFKEKVARLVVEANRVVGAATDQGTYRAPVVIDAAGAFSGELARSTGCQIPVMPESHEAGITEPVAMFCPAMVVDLRPAPGFQKLLLLPEPPRPDRFLHHARSPHPWHRHALDVGLSAPVLRPDDRSDAATEKHPRPPGVARHLPDDQRRVPPGGRQPGLAWSDPCHRHVRPGLHARPRHRRGGGPSGHRQHHGR